MREIKAGMVSGFAVKVFAAAMFAQGTLFVGALALAVSGVPSGVVAPLYGSPARMLMRWTGVQASTIGGDLPYVPWPQSVGIFLLVATGYSLIAVIAAMLVRVGWRRARGGRVSASKR